jgi:peptidoglycan/xylan/chitin deacetylase (PgdA/CDA1 family)
MTDIHIVTTMDVEPVLPDGRGADGASGPPSYAFSERAIAGYARIAAQHGYPVTFLIHPEATHAHADLFRELEAAGACLGLHLHPWKFADGHYRAHFGGLTAAQQTAILSEAVEMWRSGLGRRPQYFRPGTFSANDFTFEVLETLGFLGGSISVPGRVYPDLNAVWAGAVPDPHPANAVFRQLAGELSFVNIPLSVDLSSVEERGGRQFCWDLRPDWAEADYTRIATNIVTQVLDRNPQVPVLQIVTHNDNDFSEPSDRVCGNFRLVLEAVGEACRRAGARPVGATFADVTALVRQRGRRAARFVYADKTLLTG